MKENVAQVSQSKTLLREYCSPEGPIVMEDHKDVQDTG